MATNPALAALTGLRKDAAAPSKANKEESRAPKAPAYTSAPAEPETKAAPEPAAPAPVRKEKPAPRKPAQKPAPAPAPVSEVSENGFTEQDITALWASFRMKKQSGNGKAKSVYISADLDAEISRLSKEQGYPYSTVLDLLLRKAFSD